MKLNIILLNNEIVELIGANFIPKSNTGINEISEKIRITGIPKDLLLLYLCIISKKNK